MNPIHAVCLVVVSCSFDVEAVAQSGWFLQPSGTTTLLWSVFFTNANTGTAIGNGGSILRTTNGGMIWVSQSSGTAEQILGVCFAEDDTGTAVGSSGTILRTTDGGTSWAPQSSNVTGYLHAVSFTDANIGTVVGDNGTILRTTTGGTTWTRQSSGTEEVLQGVCFSDVMNGIAVGRAGTILRTADGGSSWSVRFSGTAYTLYGVAFSDAYNGIVVGGKVEGMSFYPDTCIILSTSDGGLSWTRRTSPTEKGLIAVCFADAHTAYAVGARFGKEPDNRSGVIIRTTDSGASWSLLLDTTAALFGVSFKGSGNGTVVGASGTILHTTTGGLTWVKDNRNVADKIPDSFGLQQNYPNPFNTTTKIGYTVGAIDGKSQVVSNVKLAVYDLLGREVAVLVNEKKEPGDYSVTWDGRGTASGVYFYRMQAGDFVQTHKLLNLK